MGLLKILATSLVALQLGLNPVAAVSGTDIQQREDAAGFPYWVSAIERQGVAVYAEPGYKVFRNVKDYGAVGDGKTDDTDAINNAVQDGSGRCITKCDSRTTTPAIVYFPSGTYLVSSPIVQTYYTQFIGDARNLPTIKASANFTGMAVIDGNPYIYGGNQDPPPNYYQNQNNFFRQVRNFIIDMTVMNITTGTGIHWQVAQATSLQNIIFNMNPDTISKNGQKGLFIENGSGGFMADLTFNGGGIGADIGSQQYTTRNLTFNNCNTAIHMIWDWVWLMQGVTINGGQVGINMTSDSFETIKVGSLLLLDSKISNVPVGIMTLYKPDTDFTNNTLILNNVDMSENVPVAIQYAKDGNPLLEGNKIVKSFVQGKDYSNGAGKAIQEVQNNIMKPDTLLAGDGKVFTRTKPQYEDIPVGQFVSVKSHGAAGDGHTDDTVAIQKIFKNAAKDEIIYFDHGAYIISDTIKIPKNIKITGEMWPLLMATGDKFQNSSNPKPVFEVGEAGETGNVEMSDLIIETKGPLPGAILVQWNLAGSENGAAGLWDVHFRIGGTAGTELQSDTCGYTPNVTTSAEPKCMGTFLMLHLTTTASAYIENCWFWAADHDLDLNDHGKLNIYNGRGVLIESQKPVWLWGTASEHSVLYNYQISNAKNTFIGIAQTETAYMQGNPDATQGVSVLDGFFDPKFKESCDSSSKRCARTWGMRITNSSDVYILGAGMYSFFDNYAQECLDSESCQDNMISIENSDVHLYGINTKASVNMLTVDGKPIALDKDNRNTYCAAIAKYESSKSGGSDPGYGSSSNSSSSSSVPTASSTAPVSTLSGTAGNGPVSSSVGAGGGPSQIATPQPVSPTGGYGQPGGDMIPTTPVGSVPSATTLSIPSPPQGTGSPDGSGGSNSEPPAATPTTLVAGQGSGGSGGSSGGDNSSSVVITVTETITAVGTCQTP
ncbi:glycoside hydrolase family 55 protein [Xylariaceae sp. FL1651]|nr:glycoside hydrolase family 55 protein [Xylariaceae sp. FL1651]